MTIFGEVNVDVVTIDRHVFLGTEELRMVRAIVRTAMVEAARQGFYHAAFRGLRIHAMRQALPCNLNVALQMIFNPRHSTCVMRLVTGKPHHDQLRLPAGCDVIDQSDIIVVEPIDSRQVL